MTVSGNSVDEDADDYDFDDLAEFDEPEEEEVVIEQEVLFDPETDDDLAEFDEPIPVAAPEPAEVGFSRSNKRPAALTATPATKTSEAIRRPLMSGHCSFPQTINPDESHQRCRGYSKANPEKIFQPCPCRCHYPTEEYECGCGSVILEAPHYPLDEDGDVRYVHLDKQGRVTDCECPT